MGFLKSAPEELQRRIINSLSFEDALKLDADFEHWAHANQLPPGGDGWRVWLMLAGRGFGKTRAGAEWIYRLGDGKPGVRIAVVGATIAEARSIMVEGVSGLLSIAGRRRRKLAWEPSLGRLGWPNGSEARLFSGENADGLRGPEHDFAWCDELAKWRQAQEAWDHLQIGLRRGPRPRALVTTTPRPGPLLTGIRDGEWTITTTGKTSDNINLDERFIDIMQKTYGGTRFGLQELEGEIVPDLEGSLWPRELIEAARVSSDVAHNKCQFDRIAVGVDPPAGANAASDECGIVVCGAIGEALYVLEDASVQGLSPEGWATSAIAYLKATGVNAGGYYKASARLFVPAGHYFLGSTTLDISHTLIIEGDGTGMAGVAYATKLRWAAGATGIRIQRYDTSGVSSVDNGNTHTGGDGTILRGLHLLGGYSSTEGEFHGIHAKARFVAENCKIENFQGDGIYSNVAAGSGGPTEGNANQSRVIGGSISACRNGIFIDGADTNIWAVIGVDASSNRRWGIWDSSFLGNSYFACHAEANGWINGAPASIVSYSGNRYCVRKDQGPGASTNAPSGTTADNSWWYYMGPGDVAPSLNINLWSSGTAYRDGGSYRGDGEGNANNLFSGCYHESGQAFAQIDAPALVDGGSMRPNVKGVGVLCGSAMRGGALGVTGALSVSDNLQALGPQVDFGPTSGSSDLAFNLNSTGTEVGLWAWISGAFKGYIRNIGGSWYYNAVSAHKWRINAVDSAQLDATRLTLSAPLSAAGAITTTAGGIGYAAGAGGTVTQQTSKSTAVTLNKLCGQITTNAAALAANAAATFTVNDNQVAATDSIVLVLASGNAAAGSYNYQIDKVSAGSFTVWVQNISAGSLSEALVFNFAVIKAVAA